MKTTTLVVFIAFKLAFAAPCYAQDYRSFIVEDSLFQIANKQFGNNEFSKAITNYKQLYRNADTKFLSLLYSACCYMHLGDHSTAVKCLSNSFKEGYTMEYVKYYDSLFSPIMKEVLRNYKRFRPQYLASIDTALRKEIKNMETLDQTPRRLLPNRKYANQTSKDSLWRVIKEVDGNNIKRLKEIENQHGWPGIQVIGSNQTMGDFVEPATIIIHNYEKDNLYFLNSAYAKAAKGEASWHDPERIMLNLLFRFYDEGYIKMRHTFFKENSEIDEGRSYFQLKVLADLIKTNPQYKLIFFCVRYDDETESDIQIYAKELNRIIKFLASNGVPEDIISIDSQIRKVSDDGLGKYRVAFKRVKRIM